MGATPALRQIMADKTWQRRHRLDICVDDVTEQNVNGVSMNVFKNKIDRVGQTINITNCPLAIWSVLLSIAILLNYLAATNISTVSCIDMFVQGHGQGL